METKQNKALKRNIKKNSIHIIRANNDIALRSCPTLAAILIRAHGWSREVAARYIKRDYPPATLRKMYNKIRK